MSKFKAGDLALIISSRHEENLGRVVELVKFFDQEIVTLGDGSKVSNPGKYACWEVQADDMFVTSKLRPEGFYTSCAGVREKHLAPLRGDFQPEQQKAKEEIA